MAVSVETAVKRYTYLDRRAIFKQREIKHNLERLADRGFPAGEKLDSIVRSGYLVQEHIYEFSPRDQGTLRFGLDRALDILFNKLSGFMLFSSGLENSLIIAEDSFRGTAETTVLKGRQFPSPAELNLDSFPDRLLITHLAFMNYCRLACSHCGGAGQWDDRSHTLDQLKEARGKIRFPVSAPVTFTWHEPFTLPFLLDAVKYLLDEGASVSIVSSLLGVPRGRREDLLQSLQELNERHNDRVAVNLSFDLFRRHETDGYLRLIAGALDRFPVIKQLQLRYSHLNREETLRRLSQLFDLVTRAAPRKRIANLLNWERENLQLPTRISYVGAAASFDQDLALSSLRSKQERHDHLTETRISPYSQGFFLFPGGDIVPTCGWEAPQIRSLGNIFTHRPWEIYERYHQFESRYRASRQQGIGVYDSLLGTEVALRKIYGLSAPLVTHYDNLVKLDAKRGR